MSLFDQLLVAHLLGDWVLQTEWQARNKGHHAAALLSHVLVYHVLMAVILIVEFGWTVPLVYGCLAFLMMTHAFLDRERFVNWLVRTMRISTTQPPPRLLLVMVDQSLHLLLLAVVATLLTAKLSTP